MKIKNNITRITNFFINRKDDLLTSYFWDKVFRVVKNKFNFWERISEKDFKLNLAAVEKRPYCLHIEVVNICSANCIFCAYQYQTREKKVMSDEVYSKALNEYCDMGGGEFSLGALVGDPSCDKKIVEKIRLARERKEITKISIITNAILLDQMGVREFLTSGVTDVMISLALFDRDLYEKIYRTKQYDRMKQNVTDLLRINDELGNPVNITLAFRANMSIKDTVKLSDYQPIRKYKHKVEFNTDFDTWLGEIKQEDLLEGMHIRPLSQKDKEPCILFYEGPMVFSDGRVGICSCRDYNADLVIGDINTEKLLDIWQGEKLADLRQKFVEGNFPEICNKCTHYVNLDIYRTRSGNERRNYINTKFPQ